MSRVKFVVAAAATATMAARVGLFGSGESVIKNNDTLGLHVQNFGVFTRVEKWQDRLIRRDTNGKVIPLKPMIEYRIRPFKVIKRDQT
jgi:hypothetical protein